MRLFDLLLTIAILVENDDSVLDNHYNAVFLALLILDDSVLSQVEFSVLRIKSLQTEKIGVDRITGIVLVNLILGVILQVFILQVSTSGRELRLLLWLSLFQIHLETLLRCLD
jgi:hypothetical protein